MSPEDEIRVRPYTPADGPGVREFIREHVRRDHPNTQDWLFDWFYRGFGSAKGKIASVVATWNGEIAGFRGMIPGLFQVPLDGGMEIVEGGTYAFWTIRSELKGTGLGYEMYKETVELAPKVITGVGSNLQTSAPIYLRNGWSKLDALHRYVLPLDAEGFSALLKAKGDRQEIEDWTGSARGSADPVAPSTPDLGAIASVWEDVTFPLGIFAIYRTREYLEWRYVDSPGFRYLFFGEPDENGTVIARVETICSREREDMDGRRVLRIIEILPGTPRAWTGERDPKLEDLLGGVLAWAAREGCLLADFYCTSSRFDPLLTGALPFRKQDAAAGPLVRGVPNLFQPLSPTPKPLNSFIRVAPRGEEPVEIDFDHTYIVRSENDQDRPNLLGREGSWTY
jgi:hypothetical protein